MCVALCVCVALRAKRGVAAVRCAAGDCARGKRRHKTDVLSREWRERTRVNVLEADTQAIDTFVAKVELLPFSVNRRSPSILSSRPGAGQLGQLLRSAQE